MIRLPKGMTMEQLRRIREADRKKYEPYHYRCPQCGQRFPCRHMNSDAHGTIRAFKQ